MSESSGDGEGRRSRPGRPPKRQAASDSVLAAFGVELRRLRNQRNLTLPELAVMTGYSHQHLGAVERAKVVPSEAVVTACDVALVANGRLIAMLASVIREQASIRNRRQVTRRTNRTRKPALAAVQEALRDTDETQVDWDQLANVARRPSRVTHAVVDDLEQITDLQRRLYHDLSSAEMLVHVRAHLGLLTTLLDSHRSDGLRQRVASAAAEAAGFAAWLWYDLGDLFRTRRCYTDASEVVKEAGDIGLGAYIQGYQGMVAAQTQGPENALPHFEEASESAPRSLSGVTRSWLMIQKAEALAMTGQSAPAVAAIGRAEELLGGASSADLNPWMYDFDRGSLAEHTGNCYLSLQRPEQAGRAFDEALRLLPTTCDRRGARISLGLAHARLACGDSDEALRLATAALTTFSARGSAAGVQRVYRTRSDFIRTGLPAAAAALDEHMRALQHAG